MNTKPVIIESEYDKQARAFLKKSGAEIFTKLLYSGPYFPDDKELRDVYEVRVVQTPKSGAKPREWKFKFGQCLHNSRDYVEKAAQQRYDRGEPAMSIQRYKFSAVKHPSDYSILAALTKSDPGTFAEFCADFGYSEDSIKARDTYIAMVEEWANVKRMFGPWLEQLQEVA